MVDGTLTRNSCTRANSIKEWDVDSVYQRLVAAAADEFAESGLDGARVQAIAARAGLSTGAIYNRFAGRLELLLEALDASFRSAWDPELPEREFDDAFRHVVGSLAVAAPNRGDALMIETLTAAQRQPDVREAVGQWWERETKLLGESVAAAIDTDRVDRSIDPDSLIFFSMALTVGVKMLRQAGIAAPKTDDWDRLVDRIASSLQPRLGDADTTETTDRALHH